MPRVTRDLRGSMAELHAKNLKKIDDFYDGVKRGDFLMDDYENRFDKRGDEMYVRYNADCKAVCKKFGYDFNGYFIGWVN